MFRKPRARAKQYSSTLSPTKKAIEFGELHVEVAAERSRSWQMSIPPANGRVDAQWDTVPGGLLAVRGHLALRFATWTVMAHDLAPRSQSVRFSVAVSGQCSHPRPQTTLVKRHTAFGLRQCTACHHCSLSHLGVQRCFHLVVWKTTPRATCAHVLTTSPRLPGSQRLTDKTRVVNISHRCCCETRTKKSNMYANFLAPSLKYGPRSPTCVPPAQECLETCEQYTAPRASFTRHTRNFSRVHVAQVLESSSGQDRWIVVLASLLESFHPIHVSTHLA